MPRTGASASTSIIPALGFEPALRFTGLLEGTLTGPVIDDLLAVLREALSNVARHAAARSVTVDTTVAEGQLILQVSDDGRGIGPTDRRSGLANMRRRAEAHDGRLRIADGNQSGTVLTWSVRTGT